MSMKIFSKFHGTSIWRHFSSLIINRTVFSHSVIQKRIDALVNCCRIWEGMGKEFDLGLIEILQNYRNNWLVKYPPLGKLSNRGRKTRRCGKSRTLPKTPFVANTAPATPNAL